MNTMLSMITTAINKFTIFLGSEITTEHLQDMGQYFCQSLGALKYYRVDDASCDQEAGLKPVVVDGKEKEEQPKSEISSDRCALYQHHF